MIFFDSDGVFADWAGYVLPTHFPDVASVDELNEGNAEISVRMRQMYMKDPDLFYHLTPIDGVVKLVEFVEDYDLPWSILTAVGKHHFSFPHAKVCKERWFDRHFDVPREKVVVCPFSSTKSLYAESGRVLVDDFRRNCEEWVAKGGTAILVKPGEPDVPRIIALLTQIAENQFPDDPHIYEM